MKFLRRNKYSYLRAEKGTKVPEESSDGVRARKFSDMQDVAKFMSYTYSLPNVKRAIEQYSLGGGNWQYPSPRDPRNQVTAPRPTNTELDFALDPNSIGPNPESIYHMEVAYAPSDFNGRPISLAEAKMAYEQKEPPPESDAWARRRWEQGRQHYMDMMGISGDHFPESFKDKNWRGPTEERDIIRQLRLMYPNEPEETFQSNEGIASLMARRASSELTMLQNFDLLSGTDTLRFNGYAVDGERTGSRDYPLTMGMGQYQRRGTPELRISPNADQQTGAHELSHVVDFDSAGLSNRLQSEMNWDLITSKSDSDYDAQGGVQYVMRPTEIRARLMGLRWAMYHNKIKDPSEQYVADDISKIESVGGADLRRLRLIYDDETIAKLLNTAY